MNHKVIMAGFGGQGVMLMGQLLAYSAMLEDKNVSWLPSYGPEMRGGTANCMVIVSDQAVASPLVTSASALVAMNLPSLTKFESSVKPGGLIIYNSSLIDEKPSRDDVTVLAINCNDLAKELGNPRVANIIALGALVEYSKACKHDSVLESLKKALPERHHHLLPLNEKALAKGASLIK
ncbi:2-oxoacid:acceptor oxidoreductase family protein [Clostridium sp. 'deep sea']|uniref:2-oxoacid:acceptor oxidoreductase family protein n=1 Tax=Clostridium sp. 'deep sea' TaxID=2779445 RepID=UPI0018967CDA|nr:2-oxoacid:acceptor oxidoreductase family protein [Clostridium sp. 'deep sea']QOR35833.1 2-oxoacid:acceptor oxidoreductase family protein [Clostridium sp. 'deep sea']